MSFASKSLEQQRMEEVADDYAKKGYKVLFNPKPVDLPDFLAKYKPDLVLENEREKVVVEVVTRATLTGNEKLAALAEAIHNNPGWRFELVITNPKDELVLPDDHTFHLETDVAKRVNETKSLLKSGYENAALLIAWSTVESVLRSIAELEDVTLEKKNPAALIKNLASLGVIEDQDYEILWNVMKTRNAVAHGFDVNENIKEMTTQLIDIAERLDSDFNKQS